MKCFLFLFLWITTLSARADETIFVPGNQFGKDAAGKLIVTNLDVSFINSEWEGVKTEIILDSLYEFNMEVSMIEIGTAYQLTNKITRTQYQLYFTELPLVFIQSYDSIVDEPNVPARFRMIETNRDELDAYIGIQYRGGFTQTLAKKSMEIEFWEDSSGSESVDYSLLGLHEDDKWNLQALFNEPLRINSKVANDLWGNIHTIYYQEKEPEAMNGIRMAYTELFLDGTYRGIYCIGEKVNRKQLKLKKHNGAIRGELYKGDSWGASTFTDLPPYDNASDLWGGLEYKHPDEEIDWSQIYSFVDFVMHSDEGDFYTRYPEQFHVDNAIDYFIFINLLRLTDNTGKNIYIARYDADEPYFYVPWDLDGSFGLRWDGAREDVIHDILTNGLYGRLWYDCSEDGFRARLARRWKELRKDILDYDRIVALLETEYQYLDRNGIYEREHIAWNEYQLDNGLLSYVKEWLNRRIMVLDQEFLLPCSGTAPTDLEHVILYPNPGAQLIHFTYDIVEDGILQIYTAHGSLVEERVISRELQSVPVQSFSNGLYLARLSVKDQVKTFKFLVIH